MLPVLTNDLYYGTFGLGFSSLCYECVKDLLKKDELSWVFPEKIPDCGQGVVAEVIVPGLFNDFYDCLYDEFRVFFLGGFHHQPL